MISVWAMYIFSGLLHYNASKTEPAVMFGFKTLKYFIFPHDTTAPSGPVSPRSRGFTITLRHTTLGRTPLEEWSARRKDISRQHTILTTDIHAPRGGIQTRNTSKIAAAEPR
jgi:hypothetical protein